MKIGRNQPCPCGSGKKYKRCCALTSLEKPRVSRFKSEQIPLEVYTALERHKAKELIRQQQQGMGKPIISIKHHGQQIVAVGNTLYFSPKWKTFPDFLSDYMKKVIDTDGIWGNSEISKPFDERHPLLQWYDKYCRHQQQHIKTPGEIYSASVTGMVNCYLGVAYNLYLLKHNVELQQRLIERLKHIDQFQGAYYELIVANSLIRAGFVLELEDETDSTNKHCEFSAVSQATGKKYWVEAKMRGVEGLLGRTKHNGVPPTRKDPTTRLTKQLNDALAKPAQDERLIFIDVNAPSVKVGEVPDWVNKAVRKLEDKEKNLSYESKAYVFITNIPFHRDLNSEHIGLSVMAYGLGIEDFSKPGHYRLSQMYRMKQKHIDAHNIFDSFKKYPHIPSNFEGKLSSELYDAESQRLIIGETHFFEDIGDDGIIGTVTSATVNESDKIIYYAIHTQDGKNHILTKSMTEDELADHRNHPEAFFGTIQRPPKNSNDPYDLFEFFLDGYRKTPRSRMLELFKDVPDIEYLKSLDDEELLLECCERWVWAATNIKGSVIRKTGE